MRYQTSVDATFPSLAVPPRPGIPAGINADVYQGAAQKHAVGLDRAEQAAAADHTQRARAVQQQMAMRGLQQVAQQREQQAGIANTVMRNQLNQAGGLLRGLLGDL